MLQVFLSSGLVVRLFFPDEFLDQYKLLLGPSRLFLPLSTHSP